MFADGEPVDVERARTEILGDAFNEAAGEYFERQYQYEQALEEASERRDKMRQYAGISVAIGAILALLGLIGNIPILILPGLAIAALGGGYAYLQASNAEAEIGRQQQNLEQNRPDGSVSFVSRIAVPFYLVPYDERHMVFDGLGNAPQTSVNLAHMDGQAVLQQQEELRDVVDYYAEQVEGETVLQPEEFETLDFDIQSHRQLERPVAEQIDDISSVVRDTETETIDVKIHADNEISRSIRQLSKGSHLRQNGTMPAGPTRRELSECEQVVTEMRGFEDEAASGDILEQIQENRSSVMELTKQFVDRLESNQETVADHFDGYGSIQQLGTHKHVCKECLADQVEDVDRRLNLVDEILSPETGSFGVALDDPDLDRIETPGEGTFRGKIRADIRERLPELSEELKRAFNTLPDISGREFCAQHGETETVSIHQSGALFGSVWRNLYYSFREPIMEQTEKLEKDAEEVRQNKEQKMIDLAQYEQTRDTIENEFQKVDADYQTAKKIARRM
jgi:hypothetical protein